MDYYLQLIWDFVVGKFNAATAPLLDWMYLVQWYWWGIIIIVICAAVALFSPWQWPKQIAAWVASLAVVALWAATTVFRYFKKKKDDKPPPEEEEPPPPQDDPWPWKPWDHNRR